MKKIKKNLFVLSIIVIIISCSNNNSKCINNYSNNGIKKDLPEYYLKNINHQKLLENFLDLSGLCDIKNGYNGIYIRIYVSTLKCDSLHIITFNKSLGDWEANIYYCLLGYGPSQKVLLKKVTINHVYSNPKSGWNMFSKKLLNSGILTMRGYDKIENYITNTEDDVVKVEIATKETYRLYEYPNLDGNKREFEDAIKMDSILLMVESEFPFKRFKE